MISGRQISVAGLQQVLPTLSLFYLQSKMIPGQIYLENYTEERSEEMIFARVALRNVERV